MSLSEKRYAIKVISNIDKWDGKIGYDEKDVREAVRELKEKIDSIEIDWLEDTTDSPYLMTKAIRKKIDEIFGEKLI